MTTVGITPLELSGPAGNLHKKWVIHIINGAFDDRRNFNNILHCIPKLYDNLSTHLLAPLNSSLKASLLKWDISLKTNFQIETAKGKLVDWYSEYDLFENDFTGFVKSLVKKYGVYYHGLIHLAIQLAYYRLYNQLTASYQTVSLKGYREGRLEHPITVSQELRSFVESMTEGKHSSKARWQLFLSAVQTFVKHMLALKGLAEKECMRVELFQSSHFKLFMAPKLGISSIYSPLPILATYPLFGDISLGYTLCLNLYTFSSRLSTPTAQ